MKNVLMKIQLVSHETATKNVYKAPVTQVDLTEFVVS